MCPIQSFQQSGYQPTPEQLATRAATEKWLGENDMKLRKCARALQARNTDDFFNEQDFYRNMCTKISFHGSATKGFIAMPTSYLLKVAWQEGLIMLREQRKYTLRINVSRIPEIIEGEADFVEHLLGSDSGNAVEISSS